MQRICLVMTQRKRGFSGKGIHRSCQKKKNQQEGSGSYRQGDEMAEERRKVNQQEGKTPGRRGEQIKQEEIDKEIVRREMLKQKNKNETNERN